LRPIWEILRVGGMSAMGGRDLSLSSALTYSNLIFAGGSALHLHPAAVQPMEERSHHQRDRMTPRGVQAPDQNPDGAAIGRDCNDVVLGTARLRSDHDAQSGRMAEPDPETRR